MVRSLWFEGEPQVLLTIAIGTCLYLSGSNFLHGRVEDIIFAHVAKDIAISAVHNYRR